MVQENTTFNQVKKIFARSHLLKLFFIASLVVNFGFYFLLNMILIILEKRGTFLNDFYFTFMSGVKNMLSNPGHLYDTEFHEYRNLPALVLYHFLFYQIGSTNNLDLFFCSLFILYFNFGSCLVIFKITRCKKVRAISKNNVFSSPYMIAGLYLVVPWHYFEYYHGHTQAITGFFALLGLYLMLNEKEHLGFMSWSIATIFKLNPLVWIFFLIFQRPFSRFLKNVLYCIIPQVPNIIMFFAWPKLLFDFIPSNITFSLENAVTFYRVSGTISRELSYLFGVPITGFSIGMLVVFLPITFFVLHRQKMHVIDRVLFVILSSITILPDFWTAHALYVIVPYLLWLSVRSTILSIKIKIACFVPLFFAFPWFLLPSLYNLLSFFFPLISLCFFVPFIIMIINSIKLSPFDNENASLKVNKALAIS
jgi:hypothetical protein